MLSMFNSIVFSWLILTTLHRWQYKTTQKPRISIRRQDEGVDNATTQDSKPAVQDQDQEPQGSDQTDSRDVENLVTATESTLPLETIKVDISTPAEFSNTYYEIATIKSPYTFQVRPLTSYCWRGRC